VPNASASDPLAGGVYLATELAPHETRLSIRNPGKTRLFHRPDRLRIVTHDARSHVASLPAVIMKERGAQLDAGTTPFVAAAIP
jgi:hypothetical protein